MRALRPVEPEMLFQLYVLPSNAITTSAERLISESERVKRLSPIILSLSAALLPLYHAKAASLPPPTAADVEVPGSIVIEFSPYQVLTPSSAVGSGTNTYC